MVKPLEFIADVTMLIFSRCPTEPDRGIPSIGSERHPIFTIRY